MKKTISVLTLFLSSALHAQSKLQVWMDSAKAEFKKDFSAQDYSRSKLYLDSVLALQPNHVEAHYFLGYAYSRLNSKDGSSMYAMSRSGTERCSAEFENVIKLQKHYDGEMVVLDPYSKITSEWASLASAYERRNEVDSARWAYQQGKARGGFSDFYLGLARQTLDACSKNAILISSGDMYTFPLWYLQRQENYRKDVAIVDISLVNAVWYPGYLEDKKIVDFGMPRETLDTLEYCRWEVQWVKAGNFSWKLPPTYYENYVLRGDRLLLSLLKKNAFKRDVFFTIAFPPESQLNLKDHLSSGLLVDQLNPNKVQALSADQFLKRITACMQLVKQLNPNSDDERRTFDNFRYDVFIRAAEYRDLKLSKNRQDLISMYKSTASSQAISFMTEEGKKYEEDMYDAR